MDKEIYEAVAELGNFFKELCCKTLKLDVLKRLDKEIPIILCKLEKIFPPCVLHCYGSFGDPFTLKGNA